MDQMLVWTFIHREALRARAKSRPVDIIDFYEDNTLPLGLFRRVCGLLQRARPREELRRFTSDSVSEPPQDGRQCVGAYGLRR
jgi:hypothetical protein